MGNKTENGIATRQDVKMNTPKKVVRIDQIMVIYFVFEKEMIMSWSWKWPLQQIRALLISKIPQAYCQLIYTISQDDTNLICIYLMYLLNYTECVLK